MNATKIISGKTMAEILRFCGYSLAEFAEFIKKSRSFVAQHLVAKDILPLRYADLLISFLREENYNLAIQQIKIEDKKQVKIDELNAYILKLIEENTKLKEWAEYNYHAYKELERSIAANNKVVTRI